MVTVDRDKTFTLMPTLAMIRVPPQVRPCRPALLAFTLRIGS